MRAELMFSSADTNDLETPRATPIVRVTLKEREIVQVPPLSAWQEVRRRVPS
uniref:Uncharacterized protein n=1 Tax=Nonomuraea gerenzanensis TaxID=93944 RepID=A0A1M4EE71_9ACTN|nr:hypothetical protein BN4615_P6783 [Nonomuraea gerenzanensis]